MKYLTDINDNVVQIMMQLEIDMTEKQKWLSEY